MHRLPTQDATKAKSTKGFLVDGSRDQFIMWWQSKRPQTLIWSNGYGRGGYLQIAARQH